MFPCQAWTGERSCHQDWREVRRYVRGTFWRNHIDEVSTCAVGRHSGETGGTGMSFASANQSQSAVASLVDPRVTFSVDALEDTPLYETDLSRPPGVRSWKNWYGTCIFSCTLWTPPVNIVQVICSLRGRKEVVSDDEYPAGNAGGRTRGVYPSSLAAL